MAGAAIRINIDMSSFVADTDARIERARGGFAKEIGLVGLQVEGKARQRIKERDVQGSDLLGPRYFSGRLGKSLSTEADKFTGKTFTNLDYARLQQEGGHIEPTDGRKALAIPVKTELKRTGLWPSEQPKDSLQFVPIKGKEKLIGLLFDKGTAIRKGGSKAKAAKAKGLGVRQQRGGMISVAAKGTITRTPEQQTKARKTLVINAQAEIKKTTGTTKAKTTKTAQKNKDLLYVLLSSVDVPARPYLYSEQDDADLLARLVAKRIQG